MYYWHFDGDIGKIIKQFCLKLINIYVNI